MGGKNAAVVLDDADLDLAVEQVMLGAFRSTGQKCTATSRLIVTDGIADQFLESLTDRAQHLRVGDPTDDATQMGPVVSAGSAQDHQRPASTTAAAQGATVLTGGQPYTDDDAGARATSSRRPSWNSTATAADVWTEELFGPVLAVRRAADAEEAFALANDSEFGLSAAVFTQDLTRALQAVDQLDVGVLHVNSESAGADPHVPFGGAKKSGLGPKEQGGAAREFFTHTTTVYLRGGRHALMTRGALDGVVVVDFSRVLAGPYATMMLGDFGADIIKIERPGTGDDTREWGPPYDSDGVATYFNAVNRNKRSVVLDLTDPGDVAPRPRPGQPAPTSWWRTSARAPWRSSGSATTTLRTSDPT